MPAWLGVGLGVGLESVVSGQWEGEVAVGLWEDAGPTGSQLGHSGQRDAPCLSK